MTVFLWTLGVLSGMSAIGGLSWLVAGKWPERTAGWIAVNVAVDAGVVVWIAYLLAK